jgi:hypothetical protein
MSLAARHRAIVVAAVLGLMVLTGCGSGGQRAAATGSSPDSSGSTTIDITLKGGTIKPSGSKVKVKAGKPVNLHIVADKAGELHVHSSPEQHIEFKAGTTDKTLTIDQPGVVDIEDHALDKLIVQLEVS